VTGHAKPAFRTETLAIDNVPISIKRAGRGIPIVCLAATGHDAYDFAPLAARIGSNFELVCVEWPNHGDSGADSQSASAIRYAELVEGVLWQLSIRDPIIIGNSIGGAAAIHYAARRPVRALILCDSGGLVEVDAKVARICRLFERFFAAGERGAWWFPTLFALYYRMVLQKPAAAGQRRRIVSQARRLAPTIRQAWASFGTREADVRALSANLDIPIWVAWARYDRVIPLSYCLPAIKSLKNAKVDMFDAGHTAFLEQPDQFAEKFEQFVATLTRADRSRCAALV
jgi:pimeloyl-ACP methyl ester carboxylesterase